MSQDRPPHPTQAATLAETVPHIVQRATPPDDASQALPIGFRLDEFEIQAKLGEGGFGIVYRAFDHSLGQVRAIKEYMPAGMAQRDPGGTAQVVPRSSKLRETFDKGLQRFVEEAQTLARFDHPSLVRVLRRWEAHGTAYMAMPLYEGQTLRERVRGLPERPGEAWLMQLLAPLTEALSVVHKNRWLHRDIAPDNVMLLNDGGRPLLLDFGAARQVIGDVTQELTAILKPGFAPIEQYGETPGLEQGPWTDVYALAATVHWCILGRAPAASVSRVLVDNQKPLVETARGQYSERFLAALDKALRVDARQRTQSMAELRADLGLDAAVLPPTLPLAPEPARPPATSAVPVADLAKTERLDPAGDLATTEARTELATQLVTQRLEPQAPEATVLLTRAPRTEVLERTMELPREALAAQDGRADAGADADGLPPTAPAHRAEPVVMTLAHPNEPAPPRAGGTAAASSPSGATGGNSRSGLIVALVAGGLLAAAAAAWLLRKPAEPAPDPAPVTQSAPPAVAAQAASVPSPAAEPARFELAAQWQAVLAGAQAPWRVQLEGAPASLSVAKQEFLRFRLVSAQDGYLTLLLLGPDGSITRLLADQPALRVKAGQALELPPAGSDRLQAAEPFGDEELIAVVSAVPRDFSALANGRTGSFESLHTGEAATAALRALPTGSAPLLAGRAGAACQGEACGAYGAARIRFKVVP